MGLGRDRVRARAGQGRGGLRAGAGMGIGPGPLLATASAVVWQPGMLSKILLRNGYASQDNRKMAKAGWLNWAHIFQTDSSALG